MKLNTSTLFAFDLTEKFVKLNTLTLLIAFDLTEKFVKLNYKTLFAFELTEKFVKLHWILQHYLHCIWFDGIFLKLKTKTLIAFDLTEKLVKLNIATITCRFAYKHRFVWLDGKF